MKEDTILRLALFCCLLSLGACQTKQAPATQSTVTLTASPSATATPATTAAAKDDGLIATPSGVKYRDLVTGTGQRPFMGQTVRLRYTGWTQDGIKFDSNQTGAKPPLEIKLGRGEVIKGWEIGVGGGRGIDAMRVGGKRKLVIPPELGYGSNPMGTIPPNSTLVFEVELIGVK